MDWVRHYAEYEWATGKENRAEVKVEGDDRRWYYTAKKMYKGEMHARVVSRPDYLKGSHLKKLVPMSKVTFI